MLFADTVTGANSPAMVSQGRITQIINAKPLERRLVLEESAGISGLFARRHEAELRLKAADTNLTRIEDVLGSMEGRLNSLKRQARQATRYKNVSTNIRQMEILIAYMEWQHLDERMKNTRASFESAETQVAERLTVVTALTKTQSTQSEDLPALRQKEVEYAAKLQAQRVTLQRLEDETERVKQQITEAQEQLNVASTDLEHENISLEDNSALLEKLEEEFARIAQDHNDDDGQLEIKYQLCEKLEGDVLKLEEQYNALMQDAAENRACKNALEQGIASHRTRLSKANERKGNTEARLSDLQDNQSAEPQNYEVEIQALEKDREEGAKRIDTIQNEIEALSSQVEAYQEGVKNSENKKAEFDTEISVLESILNSNSDDEFIPILHDVSANEGFEKALSRALGDSLMASLDEKASSVWLSHDNEWAALPDLPDGVDCISPYVTAPDTLAMTLSQIGVIDTKTAGDQIWEQLKPGQSLVSKDGTYWRWDGYCVKSDAPDRHAQQLEQQNKLESLTQKRPEIDSAVERANTKLNEARIKLSAQKDLISDLRENVRNLEQDTKNKRSAWAKIREEQTRMQSEVARLEELLNICIQDIDDIQRALKADEQSLEAYESTANDDQEARLETLKETLVQARQSHSDAVRAYDLYVQEQNTRKARIQAIGDERVNLQNRIIRSRERIKELTQRTTILMEKRDALLATPDDKAEDQAKLLTLISELENQRNRAAEDLAKVESEVHDTNKALKEAENVLVEAREARAHAQALYSSMQEQKDAMALSIHEQFDMKPAELPQHSAIDMDKELGDLDSLKSKKEKLLREREGIGAVNLRAEDEAMELEKEVGGLLHERNDLVEAIAELRGGIEKINKEARERLLVAFDHVNAHFQRLFSRLFVGGSAHLALIESDDPLNSGLEIFAQPPGKALQSLSLMSGGEQTMASIALIFAMFLTNPSPICVLDEIDAPLDDANVDRVCDLLDEIADRGETRFLVITHHRLTMARMHRLYGVTMMEKGVSQLVSVDLQQSFDFIDQAA